MSRYNGWWDLVKPFYDVFFLVVVVPIFLFVFGVLSLVYGTKQAMSMMDDWLGIDSVAENGDGG